MIVFAIYFMVDGPRALRWGVVFFPDKQRPKINAALEEGGDLVIAYVVGQFITSALCAGYVFLILSILHVPMALLLAVAAGVFDILPIVGFFLSVLPAMAMGLTVSVKTALLILVLYGVYHLVENYFIVPKVYGDKLRLSTLVVLLAITAAGVLAGVTGAIIVLPLVAAYPVFERLWLAPQLPPDAIAEHQSGDTATPPVPEARSTHGQACPQQRAKTKRRSTPTGTRALALAFRTLLARRALLRVETRAPLHLPIRRTAKAAEACAPSTVTA